MLREEMLHLIFTFLSPFDLFRCQRVCTTLRDSINAYLPHATVFHEAQLLKPSFRLAPVMRLELRHGVRVLLSALTLEQQTLHDNLILFSTASSRVAAGPDALILPAGSSAFKWACKNGFLSLAQWVVTGKLLPVSHVGPVVEAAVSSLYSVGFQKRLPLSSNPRILHQVMEQACRDGDLEVARWLNSLFGMKSASKVVKRTMCSILFFFSTELILSSFTEACATGHLELAKWLATEYTLQSEDVYSYWLPGLSHDITAFELQTARWLVSTFPMSEEVAQSYLPDQLVHACKWGRLDKAQWVVDTFQQAAPDAGIRTLYNNSLCLSSASESGNIALLQWLADTFSLRDSDFKSAGMTALRGACTQGHVEVVKWLAGKFPIQKQNALELRTLARNHFEIMDFLDEIIRKECSLA